MNTNRILTIIATFLVVLVLIIALLLILNEINYPFKLCNNKQSVENITWHNKTYNCGELMTINETMCERCSELV